MVNKIKDENLEKILKDLKVSPDKAWQENSILKFENLSEDSVTDFENNRKSIKETNLFINLFFMKNSYTKFAVVAAALLVIIASGFVLYTYQTSDALSPQEKEEILKKLAASKSRNSLISSSLSAEGAGGMALDAKLSYMPYPSFEGDSYYHDKRTTRTGNAYSQCKSLNGYNLVDEYITESFSYYDEDTNRSKYIQTDLDGNLIDYSLNEYEDERSESIYYKGGDFAIRTVSIYPQNMLYYDYGGETNLIYETESSGSDSATSSSDAVVLPVEPSIDQYYSENQDVVGTENVNGRKHYIIETFYYTSCDDNGEFRTMSETTAETGTKVINRDWVDADTFVYSKSETYINNVSSNNLVTYSEATTDSRDVDFASVSSNFNFDYSVEIKEIVYDNSDAAYNQEQEIQNTVNNLVNTNSILLVPSNSQYLINSIYAPTQISETEVDLYTQYLRDRSFYANTTLGNTLYQQQVELLNVQFQDIYIQPVYTLDYTIDSESYSTINISSYGSENTVNEILRSEIGEQYESKVSTPVNVAITINGQAVNGSLYTYSYGSSSEPSGIEGDILIAPDSFVSSFVLLNLNNRLYKVQNYSGSSFDYSTVSLSTINVVAEQDRVRTLVTDAMNRGYGVGGGTEPMPAVDPAILR